MTEPTAPSIDLAGLRGLLAKATPGPWHLLERQQKRPWTVYAADDDLRYIARCQDGPCFHSPTPDDANAALIVAAVNALPSLLSAAEREQALVERVRVLEGTLFTALGNLMNCRIDAETGEPKVHRVAALLAAERRARAALANAETRDEG